MGYVRVGINFSIPALMKQDRKEHDMAQRTEGAACRNATELKFHAGSPVYNLEQTTAAANGNRETMENDLVLANAALWLKLNAYHRTRKRTTDCFAAKEVRCMFRQNVPELGFFSHIPCVESR